MEEKEPVNGSEGGGGVKVTEEHTHGGSEGSHESKTSDMSNTEEGKRESVESMVSPSLDRLIAADAFDDSKNGSMSAKNKKRKKEREKKKAKRDKAKSKTSKCR